MEFKLEVVVLTLLAHDKSVMGSMVVQDDVDRGRCFTSWERLANLSDKRMESVELVVWASMKSGFVKSFQTAPITVIPVLRVWFSTSLTGCS